MTITEMARDMLERRAEAHEALSAGLPMAAGLALDEEAMDWAAIVRRLRTVQAAR